MKKIDKVKQGKTNRRKGALFESVVRKDLEEKGWIISKWMDTVDLENNKLIPSKRKYNPFKKVLVIGTGFPDFLAFKKKKKYYDIIGVESKSTGYLDKDEKEKCEWLISNNIFSKIIIASKDKKGIRYKEFRISERRLK